MYILSVKTARHQRMGQGQNMTHQQFVSYEYTYMCVRVCASLMCSVCVHAYLHLPHPEKKQSDSELAKFQRSPESHDHSCLIWNCH